MEKYKYSGKSKEEAINKAQEELQELESNLFIREISETKAGLFKSKKVEIEVIEKRDVVQHIKEYLIKILKSMGITANIEIKNKDDVPKYIIYSDNDGILIGKNGQTLSALTTIVKQFVYNQIGLYPYINLDVENYKDKQIYYLEKLAKNIAREVRNTKQEVVMENMNSYERRIVHNVLTDFKGVITESEGEEPNRHVIVKPERD